MRKSYGIGHYSVDANEAAASLEPRLYKRDGTVHGAIYCHGHSALTHASLSLLYNGLFLGDVGFTVAGSGRPVFMGDFQDNSWGNDACVSTMLKAWEWMDDELGCASDGVYLMGGSMGMLSACNFAHWVLGGFSIAGFTAPDIEIKAIAGIIPQTDYEDVRARNYSGYAAEIVAAYGGQAAYDAARPTHNPIEYAAALSSIPIKLWYSSDDPACPPAIVEDFADQTGAELESLGAIGHSYAGMDRTQITAFFDANP